MDIPPLEPCPFCGNTAEARLYTHSPPNDDIYSLVISCDTDACFGQLAYEGVLMKESEILNVINRWNTRPTIPRDFLWT